MQDLCPNCCGLSAGNSRIDIIMIRKNSLFCKLIRIKSSSKALFDSFMDGFSPEMETCPSCGASHSCQFHASYDRNLIDFISGRTIYHTIKVQRVVCTCGHTLAILPDLIIPYSTYGLLFILRVISEYILHLHTVEDICLRFSISHSMLYRWCALFLQHKELWLGVLTSMETSPLSFLKYICTLPAFSTFAASFARISMVSFLQSHANPAHYRQTFL